MNRLLLLLLPACLQSSVVVCGDGRVCPAGTRCDSSLERCVSDAQLAACDGAADGALCMLGSSIGSCEQGACILPVCGDGVRTGTELCEGDDLGGETCESLGYYFSSPLACTPYCTLDVQACRGRCGDGIVEGSEVCDGEPPSTGCLGYAFDYGQIGCALCGPEFSGCGEVGWRDMSFQADQPVADVMAIGDVVWASGTRFAARQQAGAWTVFPLVSEFTGDVIWARGADDVLAAGSDTVDGVRQPAIDRFDGTSWQRVLLPSVSTATAERLVGITGLSSGEVYAISFLALYEMSGTTWTRATLVSPSAIRVWAAAPDDIWIARNATRDLVRWNGSTLTPVPDVPASANSVPTALWGADATHVFVGFSNGLAVLSGSTWSFLPVGGIADIHGVSANDVIVSATSGVEFHWDGSRLARLSDPGTRSDPVWHAGNVVLAAEGFATARLEGSLWVPTTPHSNQIDITPNDVWATDGAVFVANDVGLYTLGEDNSWVELGTAPATALWGASESDVWGVDATSRYVLHYTTTWQQGVQLSAAPLAIWGSSPTDLWIVTYEPPTSGTLGTYTVLRGDGASFTPVHTGSAPKIGLLANIQLHGSSDTNVWLTLGDDRVVHWNGATWTTMTVAAGLTLNDVWALAPDDVTVVGDAGAIYRWTGTAWTTEASSTPLELAAVWASGPSDRFVAGAFGTIVHDSGNGFARVRDPRPGAVDVVRIAGSTHTVLFGRTEASAGDLLYRLHAW